MSIEDLKKFSQLCAKDKSVQKRVKEIGMSYTDALIDYARDEHGLVFDRNDMKKLALESGNSNKELSEEDLERVSGGVWTVTADDSGFLVVK